MSSIVLKVVFNGSAHRFTLAKPSMSDLIAQLKLSYPNLPADAHIKYEDDENEMITISTDNELMEAFNVAVAQGSRTLKLIVSTPNAPNSPNSPSSNVEDSKATSASASASRAASPSRVEAASPKPAPAPAAAAPATPKPEPVKPAAPAAAAAGAAKAEEKKEKEFPGREELVDLLLSLVKNAEFQAALPQLLNALLDELAKPAASRSARTVVERLLSFAVLRNHVVTDRLLPFLDQLLPCADICLSRVNPTLVSLARPLVPVVATMLPSVIACLERLKAGAADGAAECPLGDLAGLFSSMGPCGLAGLSKLFGPPRACGNGDVEFDLGSIPIPPFLGALLGGLNPASSSSSSSSGCPRSRSQPRGGRCGRRRGCGPCGPCGPCPEPASASASAEGGGCPRSQSVPRHHAHHPGFAGFPGRPGFGGPHPGFAFGFGPHPHPHPHPHGPHGFAHAHPHPHPHGGAGFGPHGFAQGGPRHFHGPRHGVFGGRCTRNDVPAQAPAAEGQPHIWRNFACDGCNAHPIQGIRYHCTICKDFDLCEACEAQGVHPRHHPLVKLHVPRPPPSDEQAVHHGVTCDMCHVSPITGWRYRCTVCPDFDMCEACEAKRLHPAEHPVIKLRTEKHFPAHLPPVFAGAGAGQAHPQANSEASPSAASGCPRRRGCGGRWRRFMAAAAEAAAAASSSGESKESPAVAVGGDSAANEEGGCPMFACAPPESAGPAPAAAAAKGPQAVLVRHVTLANGSKLEQGQVLVKTWSVQNSGAEAWPEPTKLIFLRGDRELLGETEEFSVVSAQPGQTVEISVPITTPTKAGNYSAYFQLANADRAVFGPRLWMEVTVTRDEEDERKHAPATSAVAAPAATVVPVSAPASASASAPVVDTSGWVDVKVETSPVLKPAAAPATPVPAVPAAAAPAKPAAPAASAPAASAPAAAVGGKYAAQLVSLAAMGFNNAELNMFLLEKHNGDIQQVTNWLLENMNH